MAHSYLLVLHNLYLYIAKLKQILQILIRLFDELIVQNPKILKKMEPNSNIFQQLVSKLLPYQHLLKLFH